MIQGSALPDGQWRFLQLTIFIGGWMLLSPLLALLTVGPPRFVFRSKVLTDAVGGLLNARGHR